MNEPKFEINRIQCEGKPAVECVVWNSISNPELHKVVEELGYQLTPGIENRRRVICKTPAEVDAVRNPLAKFFKR